MKQAFLIWLILLSAITAKGQILTGQIVSTQNTSVERAAVFLKNEKQTIAYTSHNRGKKDGLRNNFFVHI